MSQPGDENLFKANLLDSSEDKLYLNYVSDPPSLQSIALVAVAVSLAGYPDWAECCEYPEEDCPVLEKLLEKVTKIHLPKSLKDQVYNIIRPIFLQLNNFFSHREIDYNIQYCDLNELYKQKSSYYWTMEGTLNQVRLFTDILNKSKELNDENIDFMIWYKNACVFCLEEHISDLWLKVSTNKHVNAKYFANCNYHRHIYVYWTALLNNELPSLLITLKQCDFDNIYNTNLGIVENMISSCIAAGNLIGLKYFWQKLTEQEINVNIEKWIVILMEILKEKYHNSCDMEYFNLHGVYYEIYDSSDSVYQGSDGCTAIMCFLLSHLNSRIKQKINFQTHSETILNSLFCHWPLQRLLLPTIDVMMMLDALHENVFLGIMAKITDSITKRKTQVLLREIWKVSPLNLKEAFIKFQTIHATAIPQLLTVGDDVTIDMILSIASADYKKKIIFRMTEESVFHKFWRLNKFDISTVDRLALKMLSGYEDLHLFKQVVMSRHAKQLSHDWILTVDFFALYNLWDWASYSSEETRKFKQIYIDVMDIYKSLILLGNYEHVNDFLNWYFETEEEIFKFKSSFVHRNNIEKCRLLLRSLRRKGEYGWELFLKFQNYNFNSSDEITHFKKMFSCNLGLFKGRHNRKFVELFLNWCADHSGNQK